MFPKSSKQYQGFHSILWPRICVCFSVTEHEGQKDQNPSHTITEESKLVSFNMCFVNICWYRMLCHHNCAFYHWMLANLAFYFTSISFINKIRRKLIMDHFKYFDLKVLIQLTFNLWDMCILLPWMYYENWILDQNIVQFLHMKVAQCQRQKKPKKNQSSPFTFFTFP